VRSETEGRIRDVTELLTAPQTYRTTRMHPLIKQHQQQTSIS